MTQNTQILLDVLDQVVNRALFNQRAQLPHPKYPDTKSFLQEPYTT